MRDFAASFCVLCSTKMSNGLAKVAEAVIYVSLSRPKMRKTELGFRYCSHCQDGEETRAANPYRSEYSPAGSAISQLS